MRNTLFTAVSKGARTAAFGLTLLAFGAPLLIAATPIQLRPAPVALPAAVAAASVAQSPAAHRDPMELACWLALSIGTGGIVIVSRRRRPVTTA